MPILTSSGSLHCLSREQPAPARFTSAILLGLRFYLTASNKQHHRLELTAPEVARQSTSIVNQGTVLRTRQSSRRADSAPMAPEEASGSEVTAVPPPTFACPYPGCRRSFSELWRLRKHHRAPDLPGMGQRGHDSELTHCPRCMEPLKPNTAHIGCSGGLAAPMQAAKRKRYSQARERYKMRRCQSASPASPASTMPTAVLVDRAASDATAAMLPDFFGHLTPLQHDPLDFTPPAAQRVSPPLSSLPEVHPPTLASCDARCCSQPEGVPRHHPPSGQCLQRMAAAAVGSLIGDSRADTGMWTGPPELSGNSSSSTGSCAFWATTEATPASAEVLAPAAAIQPPVFDRQPPCAPMAWCDSSSGGQQTCPPPLQPTFDGYTMPSSVGSAQTEPYLTPHVGSAAHHQQLPYQPLPLLPPHMHPDQVPLFGAAYPSGLPAAPSATPAAPTLRPDTDCELQSWAWEHSLAPINTRPQHATHTPRYPSPFSPMGSWLGDADAEVWAAVRSSGQNI